MSLVRSLSPDVRLSVTSPFADLTDVTLADEDTKSILVESRSWRDRNLKFGLNCDLEVDNLKKKN